MNRRETERILDVIHRVRASGERAALATVVRVKGSAYRREGARIVVREDRTYECLLSGGCLEPAVADAAARVMASGEPVVVTYDLTDDSVWGLGIGCTGAVDILIERLGDDPLARAWFAVLERADEAVLVTGLSGVSGRLLVRRDEGVLGHLDDASIESAAIADARARLVVSRPLSRRPRSRRTRRARGRVVDPGRDRPDRTGSRTPSSLQIIGCVVRGSTADAFRHGHRPDLRDGSRHRHGAIHCGPQGHHVLLLLCALPDTLPRRTPPVDRDPAMTDPEAIRARFREQGFIVNDAFATALQLMLALEKPLLIEGPAGVGKTESAKVLAAVLGTRLIRLQCYEGLDTLTALYEWNYPRQMLRIRLSEMQGATLEEREAEIFGEQFLLKRPLLEAITEERSPVLLIDEVDRADEAFEAFLLEVLAEWQVTIPELGTIRARQTPHAILTSNRTRALSDALRRRCLFLWLPYPSLDEEIAILHARVPGLSARLAGQIARAMEVFRRLPLQKAPGVAESLDWARALLALHREHLDGQSVERTLGCVLKVHEDHAVLESHRTDLDLVFAEAPTVSEAGGYRLKTDFGSGSVSTPRK